MDTKSQAPGFCVSFAPFVVLGSSVWPWWWGEHQRDDEAAQCVSDRRRHPITLTKSAR
jgi:hypothetical protein